MSRDAPRDASLRLFAEHAGRRSTGIVTVANGRLRRLFCLERGRLVFAASNLIEEQFDEVLVQGGLLEPGHRNAAKVEASRAGVKLNVYLRDEHVVAPSKLIDALELHIRGMLGSSLTDPAGDASFSAGRPDLSGDVPVDLSGAELVLALVRTHPAEASEVRVCIGPPDVRPERTEIAEQRLDGVWLDPPARAVLERADGSHRVEELCAAAAGAADERDAALRALYGLVLLGTLDVEHTDSAASATAKGDPDAVSRNEIIGRIRVSEDADHYAILGVESNTENDAIREAYYYLARRYHPDRFRTGELLDMVPQVESYFAKVTEAYNTLNDQALRDAYDVERQSQDKKTDAEADPGALARQNFVRAKLMISKKRFHDAVTFLENAVQLDDGTAEYHLELGQLLGRNPRRRNDAEQHLLRAVEIEPARGRGYFALGELYLRLDRPDDARKMFEEVLQWEPNHAEAKAQLAGAGGQRAGKRGLFGG